MSESEAKPTTPGQDVTKPSPKRMPKQKRSDNKSSNSKSDGTKAQDKTSSKEVLISLKRQEDVLKNITKGLDRQSKETGNLQVQIAHLEKQSTSTDRTLAELVSFIHNKGWKKKKKNK